MSQPYHAHGKFFFREKFTWVWLKGHDRRRNIERLCLGDAGFKDFLVAEVQPVEIAERYHRAFKIAWAVLKIADNAHYFFRDSTFTSASPSMTTWSFTK